jgi:ATP-binding cassette subfamily B multidrug efflux pump
MKQLWRLRPFLRAYRLQILISLIALLALTAGQLVIPAVIREVIDQGLAQGDVRTLVVSAAIILAIGIALAFLTYAQSFLSEWIATHIGYDLRNQLYNHIQNLSFTYHDHAQTGQLISRCIEDVRSIERFTGTGVVDMIRLILLAVGIGALLFMQNPRLAAISLLPMIPLILITTDFGRRVGGLFLVVDNCLGDLSSRLQENVTGVQVVRAFAREPYEIDRFDRTNRRLFKARLTVIGEWAKILPSSAFLVTLSTILILWFGGQMVIQGTMTVGEVVAFNSYMLLLMLPTQQLTWLVNLAGEAVAGVQRTYEILDTLPEIQTPPDSIQLSALDGRVVFEDVSLNYMQEALHALQNIQLCAEPNQIVAIMGPTGSGKTSLVNLIPRFYDASRGRVLVDGVDVRQVELPSLRRQIGIVLQTSLLFSVSIRENIAYGKPDASLEEIVAAAQVAQAHDFISELPQGYDTVVGERGVTLSGGQRQRVAIARALLMQPRILILDDSTSSVDTETERLIQQALENLMQGRTTFVIAHRLSTVRRADLILVMQDGQIVERGAHNELIQAGGLYRQIYDLQLRDQDKFPPDTDNLETPEPNRGGISRSENMES